MRSADDDGIEVRAEPTSAHRDEADLGVRPEIGDAGSATRFRDAVMTRVSGESLIPAVRAIDSAG